MITFKNSDKRRASSVCCDTVAALTSKLAAFLIALPLLLSCTDLFETDSDRQIFDPALDEKTDSMFYMLGIMKGLQQVADQYVLTNEMRGDLVATNSYTETDLRRLANFTADQSCKYDSAYKYYRIINNCNYYIAHRDSTLMTGSRRVTIPEIAQAHAVRAWAYLQLVKNYRRVPFYTEPLVNIADADKVTDSIDLQNIVDKLAPGLMRYSGTEEPNYDWISAGVMNSSSTEKKIVSRNLMIPVEVILGDLCLETHRYAEAAKAYFAYIQRVRLNAASYCEWPAGNLYKMLLGDKVPMNMPSDGTYTYSWRNIFAFSSPKDSVTCIPLAANRLRGQTTELPHYFGYNFYSTAGGDDLYLVERQIDASETYTSLCSSQDFYYKPVTSGSAKDTVLTAPVGDMRRMATFTSHTKNDSTFEVMNKFNNANVPLYRAATVYLRLAEAVNRWGYPDVAFAILKDASTKDLVSSFKISGEPGAYISDEGEQLLTSELPFFTKTVSTSTTGLTTTTYTARGFGWQPIHARGTYYTAGPKSPYQYDAIVGKKIAELQALHAIAVTGTKRDTINAVEDLLCDEMALELAFEGARFGDLTRMARHKNDNGLYGSNFGSQWLARKLAYKNPAVSLLDERNWYLPF
jgi:hypothetical protein